MTSPFEVSPFPYITLTAPHEDFCLSPLQAWDEEAQLSIWNDMRVARFMASPVWPYTKQMFDDFYEGEKKQWEGEKWREVLGDENWFRALRRVPTLEDPQPRLLGSWVCRAQSYRFLGTDPLNKTPSSEAMKTAQELNAARHPREADYELGWSIDPSQHGLGLGTSILRTVIERWYMPILKPTAGELSASCYDINYASRRVMEKNDFVLYGFYPDSIDISEVKGGGRVRLVYLTWKKGKGGGGFTKQDSIFKDLPEI